MIGTAESNAMKLPPEQEAVRAKCFHSSGTFVEFRKQEIEQSISERFENTVAERILLKIHHHSDRSSSISTSF